MGCHLLYTMSAVMVACAAAIAIYWWINKEVLTDARFYDPNEVKKDKKSKAENVDQGEHALPFEIPLPRLYCDARDRRTGCRSTSSK